METIKKLQSLIHEEDGLRLVAGSMSQLMSVTESDHTCAGELVEAILRQVSLTERLLSLANTVGMRPEFTQSISTVQGAALLLGTAQVQRIAVMLTAYEGISRIGGDSKAWLSEFQVALVAAELSRLLSAKPGFGTDEECATVTLLRGISRILTACADTGARERILSVAKDAVLPLETASKQELGLSYSSISQGAVNAWQLPQHIYERVAPVARPVEKLGASYSSWVQAVSACAYDIAECLLFPEKYRAERLKQVLRNFPTVLSLSLSALTELLNKAVAETRGTCHLLGAGPDAEVEPHDIQGSDATSTAESGHAAESVERAAAAIVRGITAALGDIAMAATQGKSKKDVFSIAVEGLARSTGATRAALVLRNLSRGAYDTVAAHGMPAPLARKMSFPARFTPDLVSAVVASGRDFVCSDTSRVKAKLPSWYSENFGVERSFALFPISSNGEPVGFLYADWQDSGPAVHVRSAHDAVNALKAQLGLILRLP